MPKCKAKTSKGTRCKNPAQDGSEYCHVKSHGPEQESTSKSRLNPKQERFCQLYVSKEFFGHGTESYAKAYGLDLENDYKTASAAASRLLINVNILDRINELLDASGLNNEFVDKQLLFLITQNADLAQKNAAIREFNKIRQRITERHDHNVNVGGVLISPKSQSPEEWAENVVQYQKKVKELTNRGGDGS